MRINIKPISVNTCWRGRRFKTPEYKVYEEELLYKLPRMDIDSNNPLEVNVIFGISKASDIDNPIKPFLLF